MNKSYIILSILSSIIIALSLSTLMIFIDQKVLNIPFTKQEINKKLNRLNLKKDMLEQELKSSPTSQISNAITTLIQKVDKEKDTLRTKRNIRWLYILLGILLIFIGFKMKSLFLGLIFINSGAVLSEITYFFVFRPISRYGDRFPILYISIIILLIILYIDKLSKNPDN